MSISAIIALILVGAGLVYENAGVLIAAAMFAFISDGIKIHIHIHKDKE